MEWGRVAVPVAGLGGDEEALSAAAAVAGRFQAELTAVYTPPDPAELTPWLGEGFVGGVQAGALDSLRQAAADGERVARQAMAGFTYPRKRFVVLGTPVWRELALECRLADLVVFADPASKRRGPFAETFEQLLMEERAAVFVSRPGRDPFAAAVVAWDGGEPASRAARRAVPLLRHVRRVIIIGAPLADRPCELNQLQDYYAARGVTAEVRSLQREADMAPILLQAVEAEGAGLMVAGAFGRSRLREFIFGGTTRALLHAARPSLFLAH